MFPFAIGSITLYAYQVLLAASIALCFWLFARRARREGLPGRAVGAFAPLGVFLGFFMGHLGYCLMRFQYALYDRPAGYFFQFWAGDYMLYGAMAGCALAVWLAARLTRCEPLKLLDALAPAGALMIALARVAQGLSGQGYGRDLEEGSWFCRFPFAIYDPYYEVWYWAVFLLAALWALAIFGLLCKARQGKPGDRALLLCGLYAAGQILLESLRQDSVLRWGFVRCSEVLSAVLLCFVLLCYFHRSKGRARAGRLACLGVAALMIALCLLLEFAMEQRISFLRFLDIGGCYGCMAIACAVLAGCVGYLRSKAD
ncbi:MAG: prolipoprotein diacylglyceryl transferase [Clostridia bacterium]